MFETDAEFEARLDRARDAYRHAQDLLALTFCRGCQAQRDARRPCPRCAAFREGRPWRHEELR